MILILVLGILVTYLLLMPIILSIDTANNLYSIQLKGLARAYIEPHKEEIIRIKIKVFFMRFYFFPINGYYKQKKTKKIKPKKQKTKRRNKLEIQKISKILKTIKVKQFELDMDTGDVITNAKLYPVFAFLNYYKGGFNINFTGQNRLVIRLQDRPIDIIKVLFNP